MQALTGVRPAPLPWHEALVPKLVAGGGSPRSRLARQSAGPWFESRSGSQNSKGPLFGVALRISGALLPVVLLRHARPIGEPDRELRDPVLVKGAIGLDHRTKMRRRLADRDLVVFGELAHHLHAVDVVSC